MAVPSVRGMGWWGRFAALAKLLGAKPLHVSGALGVHSHAQFAMSGTHHPLTA